MKINSRTDWPMWLLLAGMFLMAATGWGRVQDRIPVHWGLAGQPDRWGGKFEGLLALPLVALGVYLLLLLAPRIDPRRANYDAFAGAFQTIRLIVLLVLAVIQASAVMAAEGHAVERGIVVPLCIGALLMVLGSVLGKLQPNWFIGIRTPWTLSSDRAWTRTHRAGGRVFLALGLILMGAAVFRAPGYKAFMIGTGALAILALVVYSYFVWKDDPARTPPGAYRGGLGRS
jgi:uncharacterized membrane protein